MQYTENQLPLTSLYLTIVTTNIKWQHSIHYLTECTKSVSYTHLDVYKRQSVLCVCVLLDKIFIINFYEVCNV